MRPIEDPDRNQELESSAQLFREDKGAALGRIAGFQYFAVAVFLFLIAGFWKLQIREHEANSEAAERNSIKNVPIPAPRGRILDRDGRVIVDNQPSSILRLTQENLKPEHLEPIAEALHLDVEDLRAKVKRYASGPKYVPIPIKQELTPSELTFVESHRDPDTFPELEVLQAPRRLYPQGGVAAHVLGYVGEISDQELNSPEFAKYSQGDMVGKFGLERQYNDQLIGVDGQRRVIVDSRGREREVLESTEAIPGRALQLTIDLDLQAVAELGLEGKRGAAVALDPRTGEVLAMVSKPAFDPNVFAGRIRAADWNALVNDPFTPLLNRAIQAQFAPGSTFKPIVAVAALETGEINEHDTVSCPGGANWYGRFFKCHAKHGTVDLHRGIVQSCDTFFYNTGNKVGIDRIAEYATMAGLGKKTGIDLPSEAEGVMPSTKWKLRTQRQKWYAGETISVSVGQGAVTITPIQLAAYMAGLASGGVWYQPHLVRTSSQPEPIRRADWKPETIHAVVSGLYGVVNEGGTAAASAIPGLTFSGKTGSAQRISNELRKSGNAGENLEDNGWFVGFAPRDNPEIVVAVLLESGLHGNLAAPIARDVVKAFFDKKARLTKSPEPGLALLRQPGR
jgi:penicillin-binding protein 2